MNDIIKEEKEYLENVKTQIVREIEYYKKELIEIPKRYTNVTQGDAFLVQSLMTSAGVKLGKLEGAQASPYFGRVDFLTDGTNQVLKVYVGKTNISDENHNIITTDWRAPICSLYYDSDMGKVSYNAPSGVISGDLKLKRQIIINNGELFDVLDTSTVTDDELLQPYLSVNADNKMKTIIASIQKEQNSIIRRPIVDNIIVQGVAGSGKTSVALHRIACLVYNLGDQIKSNQFLVIGPNKYFLNYISSILPELETDPVDQFTYEEVINKCSQEKILTFTDDESKYNHYKKIQQFKSSLNYKNMIDKYLLDYKENKLVSNPFIIDGQEVFSVNDIKKTLFSGDLLLPNFERALTHFTKKFNENMEDIYDNLNQKYREVYIKLPKEDPRRKEAVKRSVELSETIKKNGVKILKDYFKKMKLKSVDIYKDFLLNISKYNTDLSLEELNELKNNTLENINKKKVTFEDLPALMHMNFNLYGTNQKYRHIVIDEAQDYGMFHFYVLKEMFPSSTFSIYGDLAQSIYAYRSINDWESVVSSIFDGNCEILQLTKSYRTTIEITNNANSILRSMNLEEATPVVRHGEIPSFDNQTKDIEFKVNKINSWIDKGYKSIAIICKTDKEASNVYQSLKKKGLNLKIINEKDDKYEGGIYVVTSALSKGLEFDAVMINDASNDNYAKDNDLDMHLLYVACTRALHELDILYQNDLSYAFDKKLNAF